MRDEVKRLRANWRRTTRRRRAKVRDALLNLPEHVRFDQANSIVNHGRGGTIRCCTGGVAFVVLEHRGDYRKAAEAKPWYGPDIIRMMDKLGLSFSAGCDLFAARRGTAREAAAAIQATLDDPACEKPWRAGRKALRRAK